MKLPRYMKSEFRTGEDGRYCIFVSINTRHPLFLWAMIKHVFANYKCNNVLFWRALLVIILRWCIGWNRE